MSTIPRPTMIDASMLEAEAEQFKLEFANVRDAVSRVIVGAVRASLKRPSRPFSAAATSLLEGVPGLGKTELVKALSPRPRTRIPAYSIYSRPDAGRHCRDEHHDQRRSGAVSLRISQGADLHAASLGRRNQPGLAQNTVGPARNHAGGLGDDGRTSFVLTQPFFVLATQNPIEQEGTYPLPEAQLGPVHVQSRGAVSIAGPK